MRLRRAYDGTAGVTADMPSPHVFFCYSRGDGEFVGRLVADLRTKGVDASSGPPDFEDTTERGERASTLERAATLLFVASELSVADPDVLAELEMAFAAKRRVISLALGTLAEELPLGLSRTPRVDFCGDYATALARLGALLASPTARATPPHAYYAYGRAPDPSAWSTFPESSSGDRARAHTPYPYVQSQRNEQVRAGHSLDPVNASTSAYSRSRSSVVVATACVAVAASVLVFVALVGGASKTQRLGLGTPVRELDAGSATRAAASLRPTEDWLGSWRTTCSAGPYGASTWTTLRVEATRLIAEVSDCDPNPPSLLRFEWRLDATRSRGDGQHELNMRFARLQALPRRVAAEWNASNHFGRRDWVDGVPADIPPTAASPAFALKRGDSRHELATLRDDTLSLAASLSLALVEPARAGRGGTDPGEHFTRLGR